MFLLSTTQLTLLTRPPDIRPTYDEAVFRRTLTPFPRRALRLVASSGSERSAATESRCAPPARALAAGD